MKVMKNIQESLARSLYSTFNKVFILTDRFLIMGEIMITELNLHVANQTTQPGLVYTALWYYYKQETLSHPQNDVGCFKFWFQSLRMTIIGINKAQSNRAAFLALTVSGCLGPSKQPEKSGASSDLPVFFCQFYDLSSVSSVLLCKF